MYKNNRNESGFTLIELLGSLAILSFLLVIVYGVFINGISYSTKAKDTVLLQQEANELVTLLTKQHQIKDSYSVQVDENHKSVTINNGTETFVLDNSNFRYKLCNYQESATSCEEQYNQEFHEEIKPKDQNFPIKILLEENENPENHYELKTILSRL